MAKKLINYLNNIGKADDILEIGVGTGLFTKLIIDNFLENNYWLVDIYPEMVAKCKEKFRDYQ